MKIIIPGGTGQVGTLLPRDFVANGHEVVVLSRKPGRAPWRMVGWDAETVGAGREFDGADVVINLPAEASIVGTMPRTDALSQNPGSSPLAVGGAIARAPRPPRVGCKRALPPFTHIATMPRTTRQRASWAARRTMHRTPGGSASMWQRLGKTPQMNSNYRKLEGFASLGHDHEPGSRRDFRRSLGPGPLQAWRRSGDGRQYVSWIHDRDFIRAIYWLIEHSEMTGPVNLTSPILFLMPNSCAFCVQHGGLGSDCPPPSGCLQSALLHAHGNRVDTKESTRCAGTIGAIGVRFRVPDLRTAAEDLCRRWRELRHNS